MTTINANALITAREFWTMELPGAMALLTDPERAMVEETEEAWRVARKMGVEVRGERLPRFVWCALYPEVLTT